MTPVALIFPGQGAQKVGMGAEFFQTSPQAKAIFDEADSILKNGLTDVIFNGPQEKLTLTAYCQPAILSMSVAALKAFQSHPKFQSIDVKFTAGLSLGEYGALVASGALSFGVTLKLVERRSFFMEEATKLNHGKMAAIIGMQKDAVVKICQDTGAEVANFNSPEQIVITGHAKNVETACETFKAVGAKSVIPLDVSGAFHSTLMQAAADKFIAELPKVKLNTPAIPVISNVDAVASSDPATIQKNLGLQITSSVQWVASVEYMAAHGVQDFIEIGPGKVLKGLIRRINPALRVHNIEKPADIDALTLTA
jgi:[acyl-carrier-protein] S-malonyltransferase